MSNWMSSAVSHPGAATAAAKREGLTVHAWAVKHQHDKSVTGRRARLALTFEKTAKSNSKSSLASAMSSK